MSAAASLIPELEDVIVNGSQEKRAQTLHRIANLFIDGAALFKEEHVGLFDEVMTRLVVEIETKARAALSEKLAPVANAPAELMRRFARDEDIAVAGPVLTQSARLGDSDLVDIARTKGQAHLFAISGRENLGEAVTDVLVRRGDEGVVHNVAGNRTARLSDIGYSALVRRAQGDSDLAELVGARPDIPPHVFRDLLVQATAVVQQRLLAQAKPETRLEVQRVIERISDEAAKTAAARDYGPAQRAVLELHQEGKLGEAELAAFAQDKRFDETVAAVSVLCGVPIEAADRLVSSERPDPVLILCRAAGFSWPTARAIIAARPGPQDGLAATLEAAFVNFERLAPETAQRVVRFWQVRDPEEPVAVAN